MPAIISFELNARGVATLGYLPVIARIASREGGGVVSFGDYRKGVAIFTGGLMMSDASFALLSQLADLGGASRVLGMAIITLNEKHRARADIGLRIATRLGWNFLGLARDSKGVLNASFEGNIYDLTRWLRTNSTEAKLMMLFASTYSWEPT